MEKAILVELDGKGEPVSGVAWRVARRLGWGIWTLETHMAMLRRHRDEGRYTPEQYAEIANFVQNDPRHRRHPEKLENKFSASVSRALQRLEQKGVVDRFQETTIEREGDRLFHVMYRVTGSPRRCRTVRVRLSGELEKV